MDSTITSVNISIRRDYTQTLKREKEALKRYKKVRVRVVYFVGSSLTNEALPI